MKTKLMPVEKKDVELLSGDELVLLKGFGKTPEFEVLKKIAENSKVRRAFDALNATDISQLATLNGVNIGVDFMIDAIDRAREELSSRGDDVDSKEDLK